MGRQYRHWDGQTWPGAIYAELVIVVGVTRPEPHLEEKVVKKYSKNSKRENKRLRGGERAKICGEREIEREITAKNEGRFV